MSETSRPSSLSLPRLSRATTRVGGTSPAWSQHLAKVTLIALMVLALLGPWMTTYNTGAQNTARQVGYGIVLVMSLAALRPWQHPERLLVVPWPLLLALAWCWLSAFWMLDPNVGIRRLVLTTIVIWSLFALVRQLGAEQSVAILRIMLAAVLAVNFAAVFLYPEIGKHPAADDSMAGYWRGIMGHKNFAGVPCAIAILFFIFDADRVHRLIRIAVCAGAIVFLIMSGSKTSMGICVASVAVGLIFTMLAKHYQQRQLAPTAYAWLLLIIPAIIFVTMLLSPAYYLDLVSDPAAFTGRTQIWAALIKAYVDRPWLGVGYGSFWDLGPSGPIFQYGRDWVTNMSEGHNSYLDFLVQIGMIGTLIMFYALLVWPTQRLLYGGDHPARVLSAAIVVFCVGHSFTESQLFDRDALVQVFMMVAIGLLWNVTAAPVEGGRSAVPSRRSAPERPRAPLRL
jgi:O-antigen ligase